MDKSLVAGLTGLCAGVAAASLCLIFFVPYQHRWGATDGEVRRTLPGDELVPHPDLHWTRAITVQAPDEKVWPWLVQIGAERSGYYGYRWLEALMGLRVVRPHRINPAWQTLAVGDVIPAEAVGTGYRVLAIEPPHMLVLGAHDTDDSIPRSFTLLYHTFSWVFVLERVHPGETRLVMRMRAHLRHSPLVFFAAYVVDFGAFFLKRKMLLNLKQCAEATARQQARATPAGP